MYLQFSPAITIFFTNRRIKLENIYNHIHVHVCCLTFRPNNYLNFELNSYIIEFNLSVDDYWMLELETSASELLPVLI